MSTEYQLTQPTKYNKYFVAKQVYMTHGTRNVVVVVVLNKLALGCGNYSASYFGMLVMWWMRSNALIIRLLIDHS